MVELSAFSGIRFNAHDLGDFIAPPYDVVDARGQDALYARHAHNIVRIDNNRVEASEGPHERYQRARDFFHQWQVEGVLVEDKEPCIYVLEQRFSGPDGEPRTRRGFFARVMLEAYDAGSILPHERTLRGPKMDRLELFRATRANLSPVFGLFHDADEAVMSALGRVTVDAPLHEAHVFDVAHRLWRIDNVQVHHALRQMFARKKIYIADGHHRYETALAYRDERRAPGDERGDPSQSFEHVLMFLAAVEDPGLVIFPTHRLLRRTVAVDVTSVLSSLRGEFEIEDAPSEPVAAQNALRARGATTAAFLFRTEAQGWLLSLRSTSGLSGVHPSLSRLDVTVLHERILRPRFGITQQAEADETHLTYAKDFAQAFWAPKNDADIGASFLMNPTKVAEVTEVAEAGQCMPQKSTFFYPKIPTGLVLYPLR